MNEILTEFIDIFEDITLTELNNLHYSVTIVIAGEITSSLERDNTKFNPDQAITVKIENIQNIIGSLTAENSNWERQKNQITTKYKPIEKVLMTH